MPVTVTKKRWSTSRRAEPGAGESASRSASSPSSVAASDPGVVAAARSVSSLRVLVERQRQVAPADLDGPVELLEPLEVEVALAPRARGGAAMSFSWSA